MWQTVAVAGFALLLAGWFGMFLRIRHELPGHEMARYTSHLRIPFLNWRRGWPLIGFYYQRYGVDAWVILTGAGIVLILVGVVPSL